MVNSNLEDRKIKAWQKGVAKGTANDGSPTTREVPPTRSDRSPVVVTQIITSPPPPVVVTRMTAPEPKGVEEISTKAIIGTVAGATAGAFIAYAMVQGNSGNLKPADVQRPIAYQTIEAPAYGSGQTRYLTQISNRIANQDPLAYGSLPPPRARTLGPTFVSNSPSLSDYSRSRGYKSSPRDGPIVMIDNERGPRSHPPSDHRTVRQHDLVKSPALPSASGTKVACEASLPARSHTAAHSRAASNAIKQQTAPIQFHQNLAPSVAPDDSISQVSSRKSSRSKGVKHHPTAYQDGKGSGTNRVKHREGSKASRAGSKQQHGVGDMVEDVVTMIKGTSIRSGGQRSARA